MQPLLSSTTALTIFSAAALLVFFLASGTQRSALRRLREVTHAKGEAKGQAGRLNEAAKRRLFLMMHWVHIHVGLSEDLALKPRLIQAGYRGSGPADLYMATRVLAPLAALVLGSLIPFNRMFFMMALPGVGYLLPDIILQRLVLSRREKIRRSIPDAVDLLVICVDAGLGVDQALLRVGQELGVSHPQITGEFLQINREQRAGKPRIDAWVDMAERSGLPEISALANMLMQTERFGTPVAKALRTFSEGIRQRRRQAAEEMASKTTVKIIFPLVIFIFPSIFIVLLGPAALSIMRTISGVTQ